MACLTDREMEPCSRCKVVRYLDCGQYEETADGAYLCSSCAALMDGKRRPNQKELDRFFDDPDEIYRLEQRVKDLEVIVATFAEKAAV